MMLKLYYIVLLLAGLPIIGSGQTTDNSTKKKTTISGYVTDINQNPVSGAVILIDKNKTDIVTNKKGFYKVKILAGARLIAVFTSENGTIEVPIDGRNEINFTLSNLSSPQYSGKNGSGADSVVNKESGSSNKKNVSSTVNKINNNSGKSPVYSDIYQMMAGKVPGVNVRGKTITIRGTTSLTQSVEPLFVVDEIITSNIDNISPIDVKSIEVLKGAAAGLYGSRGSNGVIKITLKRATDKR